MKGVGSCETENDRPLALDESPGKNKRIEQNNDGEKIRW